ncbi:sulfurtransferase complex subunit TusB [Vibrio algicola]|uniref:Sulfurtransferase complex subunit TusB n=1 Tax=Vibrio algicola TaxID=2662262 RepID=A0A5Q0TFX3_9VIBR|nr:sulfurtransferase complex subunit TusB [Vibrio algicola]
MLHIVKNSPALAQASAYLMPDDVILLIEDAVYHAIEAKNDQSNKKDPKDPYLYLKQDLEARGLVLDCVDTCQAVDYYDFVLLSEQHQQSMTWE